jgi:hypothetical protein
MQELVYRQPDALIEAAEHGGVGSVLIRRRVEMEDFIHGESNIISLSS